LSVQIVSGGIGWYGGACDLLQRGEGLQDIKHIINTPKTPALGGVMGVNNLPIISYQHPHIPSFAGRYIGVDTLRE
jgi:hypothetical protein